MSKIVNLAKERKKRKINKKLFDLSLYQHTDMEFSYKLNYGSSLNVSDQLVAESLTYVIEDIAKYHGDPCKILELTEKILQRLE